MFVADYHNVESSRASHAASKNESLHDDNVMKLYSYDVIGSTVYA